MFLTVINKQLVHVLSIFCWKYQTIVLFVKLEKKVKKTSICRYFHSFILLLYDSNNQCGIMIKSLTTKHITWFNKRMYYKLKLMIFDKNYNFYFMQNNIFLSWYFLDIYCVLYNLHICA